MYQLTQDGMNVMVNIISEFCHGFTIEEIAANGAQSEDEIKVMMLVLLAQAGYPVDLPE